MSRFDCCINFAYVVYTGDWIIGGAEEEIQSMGGFCDCEVLLNCYEDYELE